MDRLDVAFGSTTAVDTLTYLKFEFTMVLLLFLISS